MKGIVLRQFIDYIEQRCGVDAIDDALQQPDLSSCGAYTAIGYYPHTDLVTIAQAICGSQSIPMPALMTEFGHHLFTVLATTHDNLVADFQTCLDMLASIETVIHRDVRKLYPSAELPFFQVKERIGNEYLVLEYRSSRPFADLAHGLIRGALDHYEIGPRTRLDRHDLAKDGTHALFTLQVQTASR